MLTDKYADVELITRVQPRGEVRKKYKAFVTVLPFIAVASVVAISLVMTQQLDDDNSTQTSLYPHQRPLFLFVGDSLTEQGIDPSIDGWVTLFQYQYARSADIISRGLSGYNTRWYVKYAMAIILEEIHNRTYTPTLITVWLGTNDHTLANGSNPETHVPLNEYKTNLGRIIRGFQAATPRSNILLVTPAHIDDSVRDKYASERSDERRGRVDWTNSMAGIYAGACVETATSLNIPVLDLHTYFNTIPESKRNALLADGIHFNSQGNEVLREQWIGTITSEFPEIANTLNTQAYPLSKKLKYEDPWIPDLSILDSAQESSI